MRRKAIIGLGLLVAVVSASVVLWSRFSQTQTPLHTQSPPSAETQTQSAVPLDPPRTPPIGALSRSPPSGLAPPPSGPNPGPVAPGPPGTVSNEQILLERLRTLVKTDPARAEALARESRQRFAEGVIADERDALLVDALVNQERIGAARDESYYYFRHHPGGQFAEHLFIMTGARPSPPGPVR